MCELFALSASAPVDIKLSLAELARHGGETGIHADGWGVAFFEGRDAHIFREAGPAAYSPWVECLQKNPLRSNTVIAHIRHAIRGAVDLANTQPFSRELNGRMLVFAHNGMLAGIDERPTVGRRYKPIGDTDLELAFCELLELASEQTASGSLVREIELRSFSQFAAETRRLGPANIIVATKDGILAHADRRTQRPGVIAPPGLWLLERQCHLDGHAELAAAGVDIGKGPPLKVSLLASVPLTSEPWRPLEQGTVLALAEGTVRSMAGPDFSP